MLDALIAQCAYNTHPDTVKAIIQVESAGNPYAIGVNYGGSNKRKPNNISEASRLARGLLAEGKNIDMGLMQINSVNMVRFGLSPETIFDPCTNIRVGTKILSANYAQAVDIYGPGETALRAALSAYNTGSMVKGLRNGYVAKYYKGKPTFGFSNVYEAAIASANVSLNGPPPDNFKEILVEELDPYGSTTSVYSRE